MGSPEVSRSQTAAILTDRPVTRRAAAYMLGLVAILLVCASIFVACLQQSNPPESDRTWASGLFTLFFLGITIAQGLNFARLLSERYMVTVETIEVTSGILRRDARKIPLSRVLDVTSNSSFDQRLFGVGDITLSIANGDTITLEDITDSQTKTETLWNLVHKT
jgi:membrane protein YdbS with pleckstrin-like domain